MLPLATYRRAAAGIVHSTKGLRAVGFQQNSTKLLVARSSGSTVVAGRNARITKHASKQTLLKQNGRGRG